MRSTLGYLLAPAGARFSLSTHYTHAMQQRRGCLARLLLMSVFLVGLVAVLYAVMLVIAPWSLHIGGRFTPLLTWHGSGKLLHQGGPDYPLYVSFYPDSHFSHLALDGLRPTGGLQGTGWLCTAPGKIERLSLSGTIYGGWRSTEGSLMSFRLVEPIKVIDTGSRRGYFDLYGRWQGQALAMDDRGRFGGQFHAGFRIEHASVLFNWGSYSDFEAACASTAK